MPTVWGTVVLITLAALLLVLAARGAGSLLLVNEPARGSDGQGARLLVVEGWLDETELADAAEAYRRGRYERVVTSGGPIESWRVSQAAATYAERAADYLRRHGLVDVQVAAAPAPASAQDRTFLSAVVVREWVEREGLKIDAIDLYSAGVHSRRSRAVYRLAFGDRAEVGVLAATPRSYDADRWWLTSSGTKAVLGELLSLTWTTCCFWPPPRGSHEVRWAQPPSQPQAPP